MLKGKHRKIKRAKYKKNAPKANNKQCHQFINNNSFIAALLA
jgi:hypothetical protein